ncbi:MAG: hypothetical protein DRH17_05895 [Deltaproteobacteria bacterium]|nr:MAG: hypothetical protein DRH17_05895 [Deltaproteobacteria bacterium]
MEKKPTYEGLEQRVKELEKEALERKRAEEAPRETTRRLQVAYDQSIIYAQQLNEEIAERKRAEEALQKAYDELEQRVEVRTAELAKTTEQLDLELTERKRAEQHIRTLSQQLIKVQESERQRLSRDLHDYLAQDLSTLKIGLDTLFDNQSEAPPETRQRVSELSKTLQGTIIAVRDLAYDLRPLGLDQLGLLRTVFQYCEDFSDKSGLSVDFYSAGMDDLRLDFDTEINVYRLIQEALNNIKRHAEASHVTIRLVASFPNIILRIEDDGKGFDVKNQLVTALNEKRMGVRSMEERVALLQGKMRIQSRPTEGTRILIEVPYKKEKKSGSKEEHIDH